jgi:rubredoxin
VRETFRATGDPTASAARPKSRTWQCRVCGFTYTEALGLPEEGIAPGPSWDAIPADWRCPDCGMSKSKFRMVEILTG